MIIGTAGHVDHGKSELIKALTGIETDRLPEEKKREMSIVLGFAHIDLPTSGRVGIVDVPGHEKFLKNMLMGVRGIDVGILVVAADEGIMPQTREHFEIMRLSGTEKIVIVITKTDLADEDMIETCVLEIRELIDHTPYEASPVVEVSSITHHGLEGLKDILDTVISHLPAKNSSGIPILPVDRDFPVKGVGTVVTGSLISGSIQEGDEIHVYPQDAALRVRQVQVHNEQEKRVYAGHRTALNLAGAKRVDIRRGDIVTTKDSLFSTTQIDVKIELQPGISLKNRLRIKAYICAAEYIGRIRKLSSDNLCRITFERPVVTWFGDRFVLRTYSPMKLIGGGTVLNPNAAKRKPDMRLLEARAEKGMEDIILEETRNEPAKERKLRKSLVTPDNSFDQALDNLVKSGKIRKISRHLFSTTNLETIESRIVKELNALHRKFPLRSAHPKNEIARGIGIEQELFSSLIRESDKFTIVSDTLKLKAWKPELTSVQDTELARIEETFKKGIGYAPERTEPGLINLLIEEGKIVKVGKDFFVHRDIIEGAKTAIAETIEKNGGIAISEIKGILSSTRKYVVPFAEYLDQIKFTRRVGDKRVLYGKTKSR
jgi:selenocysteine-specific elongation factor